MVSVVKRMLDARAMATLEILAAGKSERAESSGEWESMQAQLAEGASLGASLITTVERMEKALKEYTEQVA